MRGGKQRREINKDATVNATLKSPAGLPPRRNSTQLDRFVRFQPVLDSRDPVGTNAGQP